LKHVIFDGMNLLCRSHFVYDVRAGLSTEAGIPTGAIYGMLRSLVSWRKKHPRARFWVAWEGDEEQNGAHVESRRALHASYKEGRGGALGDGLSVQLDLLKPILSALRVYQVQAQGYEADDIIAWLTREAPASGEDVYGSPDDVRVLVSTDRDLLQLVTDRVVVMSPDGKKSHDASSVREQFHGIGPSNLLPFRALSGDSSDGLPGLKRVPRKIIARLVTEHEGSLDSIYKAGFADLTAYQRKTLTAFASQALVNEAVMRFQTPDEPKLLEGAGDPDRVRAACEILEMSSMVEPLVGMIEEPKGFYRTGELL